MKVSIDDIVHVQETSLTIRGARRRTTVPAEIVSYLGLKDGGRIRWVLLRDGTLTISKGAERRERK
ncbi:MAG TPA: hypothetical protein VLD37_02275 [Candidatus Bilamarchaeum sp.]|nr:hypothetical protein [Candidatus Bilamarchaeum sp.]